MIPCFINSYKLSKFTRYLKTIKQQQYFPFICCSNLVSGRAKKLEIDCGELFIIAVA